MTAIRCPLCGEEPGPFPMVPSARGRVCRDCYAVYDLSRFVEVEPKKEEVDDELAVRVTREV